MTLAKKRKESKIQRRLKWYIISGIIILVSISWFLIEKPKAVIIDQLSEAYPNATLTRNLIDTFSEAGYKVDYIHGKEVTVDFYRSLPEQNYKYIILRAHSSLFSRDTLPEFREELTLATTELYSDSKYRDEQTQGQVVPFQLYRDDTKHFAITSRFVKSKMQGNFSDATIILMGCNGLTYSRMAQALVQKGAGTVIGWDKKVSLKHTDITTKVLLDSLLKWKMEINEAVGKVTVVFGEDREYGGKLLVYP